MRSLIDENPVLAMSFSDSTMTGRGDVSTFCAMLDPVTTTSMSSTPPVDGASAPTDTAGTARSVAAAAMESPIAPTRRAPAADHARTAS